MNYTVLMNGEEIVTGLRKIRLNMASNFFIFFNTVAGEGVLQIWEL